MSVYYCPQCGSKTKPKANFCHSCGSQLEARGDSETMLQNELCVTDLPQHVQMHVYPWRRFFARSIDLLLLALPLYALIVLGLLSIFPESAERLIAFCGNPIVVCVLTYLIWVPVEGWLLASFSTTPAKWIFGITVLKECGKPPANPY